MLKQSLFVRCVNVFGWLAYGLLFAMLALALWDWLPATAHGRLMLLSALAIALWLLRHPLHLLALWLGLRH